LLDARAAQWRTRGVLVARQRKSFGALAIEHTARCAELWQLSLAIGRGCECSPKVVEIRQLNRCGRAQFGTRGEVWRCGCSQIQNWRGGACSSKSFAGSQ